MAVPHELICSACGYALRGLDPAGNCPECGQRIRRSIAAIRLRNRPVSKVAESVVAGVWLSYGILNLIIVWVMMMSDPYDIFDVWPWFVYVGPSVAAGGMVLVWCATRRFHWLALLLFLLGMLLVAWLNWEFVVACSNVA